MDHICLYADSLDQVRHLPKVDTNKIMFAQIPISATRTTVFVYMAGLYIQWLVSTYITGLGERLVLKVCDAIECILSE